MRLPPIKMIPAFRYGEMTPWGGSGLRAWGKNIPDPRTGESLEVSVLPGLESRDEQGATLPQLLERYGADLRGTQVSEEFPLLLKLISAQEQLSVQVHPGDDYARAHENGRPGKSEAWVILSAEPDAEIIYGVREGVSREVLACACELGGEAIRDCLNRVKVRAGEVYLIPSGMIHAIGGGITLMEIQQSSDITYRFYDWDRVGASGKGRPLHIKKGLDVTDVGLHLSAIAGRTREIPGGRSTALVSGPMFTVERWDVSGVMPLGATPEHFRLLLALGELEIAHEGGCLRLAAGDSVFLPANMVDAELRGPGGALVCW